MTIHQKIQGFVRDRPRLQPLPAGWECDLADNSLTWNAGVFDLFGIPRGASLDREEIAHMYVGESRAVLDRLRADAIANARSFTFDAQIRRRDGELRWMRLTADVVCRNGSPVTLYGTKQDVTDELAARHAGHRVRLLTEPLRPPAAPATLPAI